MRNKMEAKLRNSGIDIIGDAPWGTHFCQFYKTKEDLIDILVPYFKTGLENNEFCMWITSEPLSAEEAKNALEKAVPDIDDYLKQGQIEIIPYTEWYVIEGNFNSDKVLDGWVSKLNQALIDGYDGLRLSGNTFWLEKEGWNDFVDYEEAVDNIIGKYQMIALCTYCLDKCTAVEIIDVVNNHEFALIKREGIWEMVESSEHKRTEEALLWNQQRNELLIDVTSRLLTSENPQTIIDDLCQKIMEFLECDVFFNYLVDEKKGCLHLNAYGGIAEEEAQKIEWLDYGVAVCGYAALESRRIIAENIFETPDQRTDLVKSYGVQAYACQPLMIEGKSIGTLSFGAKSRTVFTDKELDVMKAVAGQISIAMNRLISNRTLKEAHDNLEEQVEERTEELKLASVYNRSLIEASLDPLVTIGSDGKITDVNDSTEFVTGYSRDELIGTDFSDYFTEPEKAREGYQQVFHEGLVRDYELEIKHENGHITPVLYNASIYKDELGKVVGVFAAARDITEQKKAEKELELASAYNRSLIEASLDPLVTIGPNGKITDVNGATELVTGYSRDEIIGTDFSDYFTEPEKAREGYRGVFREGRVFDYPLEIKHKDESVTPVLYNASVYEDEDGEVIGVFAAARDITGVKQAEDKLKEIIKELECSNKELRSFAFITSHDLQEPLRTMGSYAGLLKRRYEGKLDSDADEFIEYMVSGALRMQEMIRGLLDYSRVETQGGEFREFSAEEALNNALSNLKSSIEECNAEITYDSLPVVFADENQIERMFQNLISNSLKFCRDGVPPKIHVSARKEGSEYVLNVQDNGIGIEEQYTGRIFEVFKRLHAIGEYEGAGIGLAIVKRIMERHGGYIWVESEFGEGSTFYFTIPDGRE